MMILMKADATKDEIAAVIQRIEGRGLNALNLPGGEHGDNGIPSALSPEDREYLAQTLSALPGVDHIAHVSRPYKLASREFHRADTVVEVRGVAFGGRACVAMAGPCAVESREQIFAAAEAVQKAG